MFLHGVSVPQVQHQKRIYHPTGCLMRRELAALLVVKLLHFFFVNTIAENAARYFAINVRRGESRYLKSVKVLSQVA